MANTVFQHKRSGTPSNVPPGLELGELAINYADGLIFYKNTTGQIVSISGSGGGGNDFGTINANGTLVVADTPGDVLNLVAGNNVTFGVDIVNDIITINASGGDVSPVFDQANAAFLAANTAFANGNTNFVTLQAAFNKANGAAQLAFRNIIANGNTITASSNAANLTIIAGINMTVTTEGSNVTFGSLGSSSGYFIGNNGDTGDLTNGLGDIFRVHSNTLTQNATISSGTNATAGGPLTIANGVTLIIQTGARAVIV